MSEPASIRYKNPGAMWPGTIATKWGSKQTIILNDNPDPEKRNKIAVFPTFVQGAAAQFDLWRARYTGLTLAEAIRKWSGHNSSEAYAARIRRDVGIGLDEKITSAMLASETGWKFMKTQSSWEAGKPYPMTDAEWKQAQAMVFKSSTPKKAGGAVAGGVVVATAAHHFGFSPAVVVAIVLIAAAVAFGIWRSKHD